MSTENYGSNEILEVKMEPTSKMGKFSVAVMKNKNIIGHLSLGKSGSFSKTLFYFLKCECNDHEAKTVDGQAAHPRNGMGMR